MQTPPRPPSVPGPAPGARVAVRRPVLLILICLLSVWLSPPWGAAWAQGFQPLGLDRDSAAYAGSLAARAPAGGTPQARRQAETRAADATRRGDWAGAAAALEARIAAGEATPDHWLDLARAQLRRVPPDPAHAAQAAWQAFSRAESGAPEIAPLLVLAEAFRVMDRPERAADALQAVLDRAPNDAGYRRMLADARRAAGLQVRRVRAEVEADPPRACIEFTTAPARRADFVPGDWVRTDPPQPGVAVTREGDQLCLSGLALGATTRVVLRAGLPGEDGLALTRETVLPVAMGNRAPRLFFDARRFVLPRGQAPRITLAGVNVAAVRLRMLRLSERALVSWTRENRFGEALESYAVPALEEAGKLVWEGRAEVPGYAANRVVRTALPLPDAFAEPGAYVLLVNQADGASTGEDGAFAAQAILRTDLAPTVWRGADGLTVQVRDFSDARPRAGVRLGLIARNNDLLGEAVTGADGVARFAAPLLRGAGSQAPQAVHGLLGEDFVALDLNAAAFDLSDRGVEGRPQPGPLDAFAWTERGIYRPGETVHLMALLRDAAGRPVDLPARVTVKRPNGQVFLDVLPPRGPDASLHLPVALSPSAPAGVWTVELRADPAAPPVGRTTFRVDAFVPDRMAVDLAPAGPVVPGTPYELPVVARYLYGAPAADLSGSATLRLTADPEPPAALAGYRVGLDGEEFAPDQQELTLPPTDAQGRTAVRVLIPRAPDTTRPVRAELDVAVDDPSGRAVHARTSLPVRPAGKLIGIKPAFDGAVDANTEAAFEVAAVDADGHRAAVPARLRLVRERPDWRLVARGGLARYETTWRDEPLESADVTIPAGEPLRFARRLDFGRYRLEVVERGGLAAASVRFRSGWVASESPDVPDKVDVSANRRQYAPGEVARLRVVAPFAGPATLLVATDRVQQIRTLDVPEGGASVEVPVDPAWGPGAYAVLHVFRPGADATASTGASTGANGAAPARPGRAIGLAWIGIDPAARRLDVAVAAPARVAPRGRVAVPVRAAPGAWVALAAVDEGVLRLTSFATPDPAAHFLGRRTLGLDIRDDWGRLILPADGQATVLRQGGDDGTDAPPEIPQRVVALFVPPVQAGPDGVASVPLDLPDFNGQLRLMAVAWQGDRVGSGAASMVVRDALVAEPLLPRFLAPGDEARLAVQLHNLDLPAGEAAAQVSVEGPLALDGPTRLAASLAPGGQAVLAAGLRATGAGRGVVRLDVTGPGGFRVQREAAILVRPARAPVALVSAGELAPGSEASLQPATERLIEGTWQAQAGFGGPVRYDPAALLRALDAFPLFCLEQTASKGLPLALFPDGPAAGEGRAARLQAAVDGVLDKQRYDGGFGMWSAGGQAQQWLSAYATEVLLRARAAGALVPEPAMAEALRFLADGLEGGTESPGGLAEQAYRLHVLALAGQARAGANRVLAERLDALPTPLAKAQLGAALARGNDRARAEHAFAAALDGVLAGPARRVWHGDYGSALRDQAAVALLLKESGLLADRLAPLLAALPGADLDPRLLSTQELAWTASAAAVLGRDGRPVRVAVDGRALPPAPVVSVALSGPARARNLDDRPVWQRVSAVGVPKDPPPAARAGMRVTRRFYTPSGDTLDLDALRQNTSFVLLLEGRAEDGQDHYAMVLQGLPAGWEIAARFGAGSVPGMAWLGELSETEAQPASDDRFAAVLHLTGEAPGFRLAVRLRAVTPGAFELPGAQAADMYRPAVQARQATGRVRVLPAE